MIASIKNVKLLLVTFALANVSLVLAQQQQQPQPPQQPQPQAQVQAQPQPQVQPQAQAQAQVPPQPQPQPQLPTTVQPVKPNVPDGANAVQWHGNEQAGAATAAPQEKSVWPIVDVDRSNNKSTVDVHVPVFFDMTNHNDPQAGKSKLDLSVMHGLVTVSKDKQRDQDGQMNGPVKVTVFGIPVYQGKSPQAAETAGQRDLQNSIGSVRSAVSSGVEATHDTLMGSLSGLLNRVASFARQATSAL